MQFYSQIGTTQEQLIQKSWFLAPSSDLLPTLSLPQPPGPWVPPTDQQTSRAFLTLISKVPQELWLAQGFHLSSHLQLEFTTQRRQSGSLSPWSASRWGTALMLFHPDCWPGPWTLVVPLRLLARPTGWNPRLNSVTAGFGLLVSIIV